MASTTTTLAVHHPLVSTPYREEEEMMHVVRRPATMTAHQGRYAKIGVIMYMQWRIE